MRPSGGADAAGGDGAAGLATPSDGKKARPAAAGGGGDRREANEYLRWDLFGSGALEPLPADVTTLEQALEASPTAPVCHRSWQPVLEAQAKQPYLKKLVEFVKSEGSKQTVYPPRPQVLTALLFTPLPAIKVVVVGQDPYHGPGQAHGLAFSVPPAVAIPPSLRNMLKEAAACSEAAAAQAGGSGDLRCWAAQGVLLLNTVLTVRKASANSHRGKGWEKLTTAILSAVNKECRNVVFLLWGKPAQRLGKLVSSSKHLVLRAPHPSPLSAYRGFFGCKHFTLANDYLKGRGRTPIDWRVLPYQPAEEGEEEAKPAEEEEEEEEAKPAEEEG